MNVEELIFKEIKKLTKAKFTLESNIKDLNIDSLDLVILVSDLEEKHNITVTDEELVQLKTVNDIIELFEKKVNK
ncbi:acyl carrier protein [Metamycoplasma equirhinis]|uniref:acyl carrier protein n=1 Tax=Metamycoplasma equirhinis TaxID=92402 RepID=UPI003593BA4E